jgi:AcrR family transcriptional regulator
MASKETTNSTAPTVRRKRVDGLRTIEKVLHAAEVEMNEHGYVKFNLDRVIEASGVSRSSVYHHFGGRDGLIAALETETVMKSLNRALFQLDAALEQYTSGEEAFELIILGVRISGQSSQRQIRQRRISSLAAAHSASAIREVLSAHQRQGSEDFARILAKLRDRGLCNPIEPVLGLAYLIQSLLVGRILVDISDDPTIDKDWEDATIEALRLMVRPAP